MAKQYEIFRRTVAGGIVFLLPLIVIVFLVGKGLEIAGKLSRPLVNATGLQSVGGIAFSTIVSISVLILIAFLAGLLAATKSGQAAFSWLERSVIGAVPQLRMARGFIESLDSESRSDTEVVLVPTDAGWCLGFALEQPDGDWWSVFVPSAPQWTSGAVVYAHSKQVRRPGLSFADAILLMRRCGGGSTKIRAILAALQEKGQVGPA